MARNHGRILAAIWSDPDFTSMDAGPQWLFMFLLSQPDLSHAGVIALRERRWSGAADDMTPAKVSECLAELAKRRFVVVDEDTEELLIRSYIRRDGVWKQPTVMLAVRDQIDAVTSQALRSELAVELLRIMSDEKLTDAGKDAVEQVLCLLPKPLPQGPDDPAGTHPDTPPDTPADTNPDTGSANHKVGQTKKASTVRGKGSSYVTGVRDSPNPVPRAPSPEPPAAATRAPARARPPTQRQPEPAEPPPLPPRVAELRTACAAVRLTPSWHKLTTDQLGEITDLVTVHGIPRLVRAAQIQHQPDRPAAYAQAWLGAWRDLPLPETADHRSRDPALALTDRPTDAIPAADGAARARDELTRRRQETRTA